MSYTNNAAWLDGVGQKLRVGPAEVGKPGPGELLIKNYAIATNPIDWKRQASGFLVNEWPIIFGTDVAGEIVEIGEGVTEFIKGQRVLAHALALFTAKNENSGFQEYTVVSSNVTCPIPETMSFEAASVLPLAYTTASTGLYQNDTLSLPYPSLNPEKTGKTLLVWGGSSSVGSVAIQLAIASGYDVITTASPSNFEFCKKLGAKQVFDYHSLSIVEDLSAAVDSLVGVYDAIGLPAATLTAAQVLVKFGGGIIASVSKAPEDVPNTVQVKQVMSAFFANKHPEARKAVWGDYLPKALANGQFIPSPEPEVIGKGLEYVQPGLEKLKTGVSAKKIVISL